MKACTKCGEIKPLTEYHKRAGRKSGYKSECKECANTRHKVWRKEYGLANHIKYKYGISLEDYNKMYELQGGACAICNNKQDHGRTELLFVDHDHETSEVRGLLCHYCNAGLGYFKDDISNLSKAILYLANQ